MSKVSGLPDTKPEGALEVTSPMTKVELNVLDRSITCTFAPGEVVTLPLTVGLATLQLILAQAIAAELSVGQLVWTDPEMVKAELAKARD